MHASNLQAQTLPKKARISYENWTKIPTKWRKRNTINLKERSHQRFNIVERDSSLFIFRFAMSFIYVVVIVQSTDLWCVIERIEGLSEYHNTIFLSPDVAVIKVLYNDDDHLVKFAFVLLSLI